MWVLASFFPHVLKDVEVFRVLKPLKCCYEKHVYKGFFSIVQNNSIPGGSTQHGPLAGLDILSVEKKCVEHQITSVEWTAMFARLIRVQYCFFFSGVCYDFLKSIYHFPFYFCASCPSYL